MRENVRTFQSGLGVLVCLLVALGCLAASAEVESVYVTSGVGQVRRTTDFTPRSEELLVDPGTDAIGIALDVAGGKMYWVVSIGDKIQRSNLDGSNVEDLVTGPPGLQDIALDVANGKMYWTDYVSGKVQRANLDGSFSEDVVTGLTAPTGIALDISVGKVYWTDTGTQKIQRANLDGSSVEDILVGADGVGVPIGLAVDATAGKLYHTDLAANEIRASNLNGSGLATIVTTDTPTFLDLDPVEGKIYWTDFVGGDIRRANVDGSVVETAVPTPAGPALGIAYDPVGKTVYWTAVNLGGIRRRELPTVEVLATGLAGPLGIALHSASGKIYWIDWEENVAETGSLWRSNLDGASAEQLLSGLYSPIGLDIYAAGSKVYWVDAGEGAIYRMDLDGTNVETVLSGAAVGMPTGIAIDAAGGKMYWVDYGGAKIRRAELNGLNAETIVNVAGSPFGIAVDHAGGKVYWTERDFDGIQRANLDGSGFEELLVALPFSPTDIKLDLQAGKFYWTDHRDLQRANLDGSNQELLVDTLLEPWGLALDLVETLPTADFAADVASGPEPLTVSFTDLSTPGTSPIFAWAWDFDNNGTTDSTLQNPTHEYADAGVFSVKLTVSTAAGSDVEVKTDYITVEAVLAVVGEITSNIAPRFIQEGDHLILTAPTGSGYQWRRNGGDIVGETSQTLEFNPVESGDAGTYTVVYDDGSKTPVQSEPFVLEVLAAGALPISRFGLAALFAAVLVVAVWVVRRPQQSPR